MHSFSTNRRRDTYFVALMASLQAGVAKDIAYANLLQASLVVAPALPSALARPTAATGHAWADAHGLRTQRERRPKEVVRPERAPGEMEGRRGRRGESLP